MSSRQNEIEYRLEYERYTQLVDRAACDEVLSAEELAFCRGFEQRHPRACLELASYAELGKLNAVPDASSRTLVDRALAQIEAEDAARAFDEVKLLRRSRTPGWPAIVGVAGFALGAVYAMITGVNAPFSERAAHTELPTASPNALARAELVYASGTVKVSGASSGAGRTLLSEGCVVETENGGACVLIDSDINVCLAANSRMRLVAVASPARRIELEAGSLATRLATQPEGMSLTITADGVASTAVGTAFSVERGADQSIVTTVLNGKVRVGRSGETAIVSAHERALSRASGPAVRPTISAVRRTQEAPSWALLGPTALWHDPVAATLEVHGDPADAEAWLDDQWLGVAPISSLIPAGEHQLVIRKDNRELLVRSLHVHAGDAQEVRYGDGSEALRTASNDDDDRATPHSARRSARNRDNANRTSQPIAAVTESATVSGADLLREARRAVRASQFREAASIYEQLISTRAGSDEAQMALVLLGELRLNQLHDAKGALTSLDTYLKRGGSLETEVRVARIEALRALQRTDEEARAIQEFLREHPRSFEGKKLRARLNELQETP